MQTLEMPTTAPVQVPKSWFNPTYYISGFIVVVSALVLASGSTKLAVAWILATFAFWALGETLAVTVFLHRFLTHGAIGWMRAWLSRLFLWFSRSGMAKYHEWVENHAVHHEFADTELDSYTPQAYMRLTETAKLPRPHPFNFWYNGLIAYHRRSKYHDLNPEKLEAWAQQYPQIRAALDRLAQMEWARVPYSRTNRALLINVALFTVVVTSLAIRLGGVLGVLVFILLPTVLVLIKMVMYLLGGYFINYYGHQADSEPFQSNLPWWLMLLTFAMLGEGWHEPHHDAPYSARFHWLLDPGWWFTWLGSVFRQMGNIVVAKRTGYRRYVLQLRFAS